MADEQYTWLNRETAERLLRGESLEAVDPATREQAERLSRTLGELSAEAAPASGELPGEQSALAAFRKAREAVEAERTAAAHAPADARTPAPGADAGLVRIGAGSRTGIRAPRPRWGRPVRLALTAAAAVGTLGGVAMAAGSGVLPTPFDNDHPRPATSVSPGTTPGQPLVPGSGSATPGLGTGLPEGGRDGRGGTGDEAAGTDDGTGRTTVPGSGAPTAGAGWPAAASACRVLRDGKELDTGRRRALEHLAGGSARLTTFCRVVLGDSASGTANGGTATGGNGGSTGNGQDKEPGGKGNGNGDKGKDKGKDRDKDGGAGGSKDDHDPVGPGKGGGKGGGNGGGRHRGDVAPAPSAFAPAHPGSPGSGPATPSPSPTYTAL
ncbi:hypothetical protein ACPCA8_02750 [Streptomyces capoamus]|uniref:hypothetical protein n=1 Tax=Streptomyces capoamus TaxID=68183 RepID=UPI003C2AE9BF